MQRALKLADRASQQDEVPVGAVVVRDDALLGEGWNQMIAKQDPTAHAEMIALRAASQQHARPPDASALLKWFSCFLLRTSTCHSVAANTSEHHLAVVVYKHSP